MSGTVDPTGQGEEGHNSQQQDAGLWMAGGRGAQWGGTARLPWDAWSRATLLMQNIPSKRIETPCWGLSPRGSCQIPFPEGEACQASGGEGG